MKKAKYDWIIPLNDYGVACEKKSLEKDYGIHDHDHYEIEIFSEGSIYHWLNGALYTMQKGDFYILSPNDTHSINLITPKVEIVKLILYPPKLPEYLNELILSQHTPVSGHLDKENLEKTLGLINELSFETSNKQDYSVLSISSLTSLILVNLIRTSTRTANDGNSAHKEIFYRITDYIAKNFKEEIRLSDIAAEVYLSPKYLSNAFSKYMGCNFVTYLTRIRIFHAQKMLVTTDKSITEIATESGFNSFPTFYRAFHKQTELSPSDYRKKYNLIGF